MAFRVINLLLEHKWSALFILFVSASASLMPAWLIWMVLGAMGAYLVLIVIPSSFTPKAFRKIITIGDLQALLLPIISSKTAGEDSDLFEAWFTEAAQYNPSTGKSKNVHSVLVRLRQSEITLLTPNANIPKRASADEKLPDDPEFVDTRCYDVEGADVYLVSDQINPAYVWNSRTPICIQIADQALLSERRPPTLYLLARSDRDMETWYRLLEAAASGVPLSKGYNGVLFVKRSYHYNKVESYYKYMTDAISDNKSNANGKRRKLVNKSERQLVWINALSKRFAWDFLFELYGHKAFKRMLDGKLANIKVPSYFEPLTVHKFYPGLSMPTILESGSPYMDSQGLWIDLDIAYTGSIRLMLETRFSDAPLSQYKYFQRLAAKESRTDVVGSKKQKMKKRGFLSKFISKLSVIIEIEVKCINGRLTINIPHPPTENIWYGFRSKPSIKLDTRILVKQEVIWLGCEDILQNLLIEELEKCFVLPNLTYLPVSFLSDEPSPEFDQSETSSG